MPARIIPAEQLTDSHRSAWSALQEANPHLVSPFFRPEFTDCVARVRDGVHAILLDDGRSEGFLPVHVRKTVARGVAGHLSDVEGAILPPESEFAPFHILRDCGLTAWRFHHLIGSHAGVGRVVMARAENPYIDLSGGYEAYRAERLAQRSRLFKEIERKARKAARTREVAFTLDDRDPAALEWLVGRKKAQLKCMGAWDYFRVPWTVPLMKACNEQTGDAFAGLVSTLRHDGRIVAAHIGLRSRETMHAWTHVYDPHEAPLSVGMVMLCRLCEAAADAGVTRIDLGRGDEGYKSRFASGSLPLGEGAAELRKLPRLARKGFYFGREAVRNTPVGPLAQSVVRTARDWARGLRREVMKTDLASAEPAAEDRSDDRIASAC